MLAPGKANWQFHLVQMLDCGSGVRHTSSVAAAAGESDAVRRQVRD